MTNQRHNAAPLGYVLALVIILMMVAAGLSLVFLKDEPLAVSRKYEPAGVMGTQCKIVPVVRANQQDVMEEAAREAEAVVRRVELLMSRHIEASEISRFNAARAGESVELSKETLTVLRAARDAHGQTAGAFDVTIRPIIELWKRCASDERVPTAQELAAARQRSYWDLIRLEDHSAGKLSDTASVDLGGIAKGYAVDMALAVLREKGCVGGLVDIGGDIACFGERVGGGKWRIPVQDPFQPQRQDAWIAELRIDEGAVCTSGNYARYTVIGGKRYSHIIDPHTGWPVDAVPSVTVYAHAAMTADFWATALSVLGPAGLKLLPEDAGIEAMIIVGVQGDYAIHKTDGFDALLADTPATATAEGDS